jgi:hypothetical protein
MTNHLRLLSPDDIINPMQMVSFQWGGDVIPQILIMLDRPAGVSNSLRLICPCAYRHGHRQQDAGCDRGCSHLRLLSPDESFETA